MSKNNITSSINGRSITFADIDGREQFLETPEARYLLSLMPPHIKASFTKIYMSGDISDNRLMDLCGFFHQRSKIFRIVTGATSSAETFEYLYHKRPVDHDVDKYFIMSRAAQGIYSRLTSLIENLPGIIKTFLDQMDSLNIGRYTIFNLGSGPGHDMIEILRLNPNLRERVHVFNIDPDESMLAIGQDIVVKAGLSESFTFVPQKFGKSDIGKAHMILMIGILCPVPTTVCVSTLQYVANFVQPSGAVVFNTVQVKMIAEDPLTDFIMRMAGWHMHYKQAEEPLKIAKAAGLEPAGSFFDDWEYNRVIVARKPARLNGNTKISGNLK